MCSTAWSRRLDWIPSKGTLQHSTASMVQGASEDLDPVRYIGGGCFVHGMGYTRHEQRLKGGENGIGKGNCQRQCGTHTHIYIHTYTYLMECCMMECTKKGKSPNRSPAWLPKGTNRTRYCGGQVGRWAHIATCLWGVEFL